MSEFLVYGTITRFDTKRVGGFLGMFGRDVKVAVLSTGHRLHLNNEEHGLNLQE